MFEEVRKIENYDTGEKAIKQLLQIVNNLESGLVTIMIKDGKIKHIEKSEKLRIR